MENNLEVSVDILYEQSENTQNESLIETETRVYEDE